MWASLVRQLFSTSQNDFNSIFRKTWLSNGDVLTGDINTLNTPILHRTLWSGTSILLTIETFVGKWWARKGNMLTSTFFPPLSEPISVSEVNGEHKTYLKATFTTWLIPLHCVISRCHISPPHVCLNAPPSSLWLVRLYWLPKIHFLHDKDSARPAPSVPEQGRRKMWPQSNYKLVMWSTLITQWITFWTLYTPTCILSAESEYMSTSMDSILYERM